MKAGKKARIELTIEGFCPIRQTVRLLGKQWTMLIIKELYYAHWSRLSFMELSKTLKNASSKVLSERLKEMAKEGLVKRREVTDITPPRVYYYLTPKGKDACMILERFKDYGIRWGQKGTVDCSKVDCELCPRNKEPPEAA